MAYFKTFEHFFNHVKRQVRINSESLNDCNYISIKALQEIYESGNADDFGNELISNPKLVTEEYFNLWGREKIPYSWSIHEIKEDITKEFFDQLSMLDGFPGVYLFSSKDLKPLYLGVSINLGRRILESYVQRFSNSIDDVFLSIKKTKTKSDAFVIESFLISKLKPEMNSFGNFPDNLTIKIASEHQSFDVENIKCNKL